MPYTIPSGLQAAIDADVAALAFAYKLTYIHPVNGSTSIGFTTAGQNETIDGVLYLANLGVTPTAMEMQLGFNPTKFEISGYFDSSGITEDGVYAEIYDFADIEVRLYDWSNVSAGYATVFKGKIGDISLDGRMFVLEASSLIDQLTQNIVELTSNTCRAELFDTRCKVRENPSAWAASTAYTLSSAAEGGPGSWVKPTTQNRRWFRCTTAGTSGGSEPAWNTTIGGTTSDGSVVWTTVQAFVLTGSVTSVVSSQSFLSSAITEASDFFQYGKVLWTGGLNQGYSREIKGHTGTQIDLYLPMLNAIQVGDTYTIYAGCNKMVETCKDKFGNLNNFRGEPHKPTAKLLLDYSQK